jgi:hypothetical protein
VFKATLDGVQTVAVKQLLEQNEYQQHKFVNEIAILRSCRNENIVCFLGEKIVICLTKCAPLSLNRTCADNAALQKFLHLFSLLDMQVL